MVLLPYYEMQALYDQISNRMGVWPAWGPRWSGGSGGPSYTPWAANIISLRCPSDGKSMSSTGWSINYCASRGDQISNVYTSGPARGLFNRQYWPTVADVRDGTSNTIAFSEQAVYLAPSAHHGGCVRSFGTSIYTNPAACLAVLIGPNELNPAYEAGKTDTYNRERCGACWWAAGTAAHTGFNTVLPPNAPQCAASADSFSQGLFPPDSYHPGGVNGCMADGSVRFINETIDTGNLSVAAATGTAPSNYGVWGAMGSISGGESQTQP